MNEFDLNHGCFGNGIVVWNRAKEIHGDYEKIAHINEQRKISWYVKNPPQDVIDYVKRISEGKNVSVSVGQPDNLVFND